MKKQAIVPMSPLLFNREHERCDKFTCEVNSGGEYYIKESGVVTISFVNGVFVEAQVPRMHGIWSRNYWRILAAVEQEISHIEANDALVKEAKS